MPLRFKPPRDLLMDEINAMILLYIFGSNKEDVKSGQELLIESTWCDGSTKSLKTLFPKEFVDADVLNLLAAKMTYHDRLVGGYSTYWFLPTHVAQFALETHWKTRIETVMRYFKNSHMGKVEIVKKIFVRINDDNVHRYLLVIDMSKRKLILLDSKPCPTRKDCRRRHVKKLALYLEEMLMHPSFYDTKESPKAMISEFNLIEPKDLQEQNNGLYPHQGCVLPLIW